MNFKNFLLLLLTFAVTTLVTAESLHPAITKPIPVPEITNYESYPTNVKALIVTAEKLSQQNLTYLYGSANPKNGGMDCSGTIHYLLSTKLKDVPRQSDEFYWWAREKGDFHAVNSNDFNSSEFADLKPGDLLLWSGTYAVNRNPPISHVMIYLGKNQQGEPLMFGASDGRTYQGKQMWGVSVFDFKLPNGKTKAKFLGYSCIPDLTCNKD